MDPGGVGALIGISIMVGLAICLRLKDSYSERSKKTVETTNHRPLLVRKQSKMNTLLPK
jgi:hypothetical protein